MTKELSDKLETENDWQEYLEFHVGDSPELYTEVWDFYRRKIDDIRDVFVREYKQSMPEILQTNKPFYDQIETYTLRKAKELTKLEYNIR